MKYKKGDEIIVTITNPDNLRLDFVDEVSRKSGFFTIYQNCDDGNVYVYSDKKGLDGYWIILDGCKVELIHKLPEELFEICI
jgi:hypothetical protein